MNHAGEPWLRRSVVSGRARHRARTGSSTHLTLSRHKRVLIRSGSGPRFEGCRHELIEDRTQMTHPPAPDALIAAVASRQHGLITVAQLARAGVGRSSVTHRLRTGRLHRRHRGVYSVGHARLSQEGEWMAAVLAAGEGAALSHLSAAKLWNAWRRVVRGVDVLASGRRRVKGVRVHICRRLDPRDVTEHRGIPVTTVPRTLVDLSAVLSAHQLANVIHEAAFRNR